MREEFVRQFPEQMTRDGNNSQGLDESNVVTQTTNSASLQACYVTTRTIIQTCGYFTGVQRVDHIYHDISPSPNVRNEFKSGLLFYYSKFLLAETN
ncbi:hypothetical protein DPMN_062260 [Dreissena polymorpha]|uniref:Uncharacterized protein n=1 Tax=Dreissena polymorpha TaxID=45954 RepID=A0A9D4C8Z3_DREPO|nr:hypothetical protein DPMN_062260 [Dreissena polymorpha]